MNELNRVSVFQNGFKTYEKQQQQATIKSNKFNLSSSVISSAELPNVSLVESVVKANKRNLFQKLLDFLTGTKILSDNEAKLEAVDVALAFAGKEKDLVIMMNNQEQEPLVICEGDGYSFSAKYVRDVGLQITLNIHILSAEYDDVDRKMHKVCQKESHDFATFKGNTCLNSFIKNCRQDVIEYYDISEATEKFNAALSRIVDINSNDNVKKTLEEDMVGFFTQVFKTYCQFDHKSYSDNWRCLGDLSKVRTGTTVKLKLTDSSNTIPNGQSLNHNIDSTNITDTSYSHTTKNNQRSLIGASEKNLNDLASGSYLAATTEFVQVVDSKNEKYYFHNLGNNRYRRLAINTDYAQLSNKEIAEKLIELPAEDVFDNYSPNEKLATLIKTYVESTERAIASLARSNNSNAQEELIQTLRVNLLTVNALRDNLIAVELSKVSNGIPIDDDSNDNKSTEVSISTVSSNSTIEAGNKNGLLEKNPYEEMKSCISAIPLLAEYSDVITDHTHKYREAGLTNEARKQLPAMELLDNQSQARATKSLLVIKNTIESYLGWGETKLTPPFTYEKNKCLFEGNEDSLYVSGDSIKKTDNNTQSVNKTVGDIVCAIPSDKSGNIQILQQGFKDAYDKKSVGNDILLNQYMGEVTYSGADIIKNDYNYGLKYTGEVEFDEYDEINLNRAAIQKNGQALEIETSIGGIVSIEINGKLTFLQRIEDNNTQPYRKIKGINNNTQKYKKIIPNIKFASFKAEEIGAELKYNVKRAVFSNCNADNNIWLKMDNVKKAVEPIKKEEQPIENDNQTNKQEYQTIAVPTGHRIAVKIAENRRIYLEATNNKKDGEQEYKILMLEDDLLELSSSELDNISKYTLNLFKGASEPKYVNRELCKKILENKYGEQFDKKAFNAILNLVRDGAALKYEGDASLLRDINYGDPIELSAQSINKARGGIWNVPKGYIVPMEINNKLYYLECLSYIQDGKQRFRVLRRKEEKDLSLEVAAGLVKNNDGKINFYKMRDHFSGTDLFEHSTQAAYVDLEAVLNIMGSYGEKSYFQRVDYRYIRVLLKSGINEQEIEDKIKDGKYNDVFYMPWQNYNIMGGAEWGYAKKLEAELNGLHDEGKLIYASKMPLVFKIADGVKLTWEEMKKMERYNSLSVILDKITKAKISGEAAAESLKVMNLQAKILMFKYDYEDNLQKGSIIPHLYKKVYDAFKNLELPDTKFYTNIY